VRHTRVAALALEARRCRSRRWRRSVWLEERSDGRVSGEEKMDWTSSRGCDRDKDRAVRCGACRVTQNQGRSGPDSTTVTVAAAVRVAHGRKALAWSKTDPGSMSVTLGWSQFGAHSFFQLLKNCSNFIIQICCLAELQKCLKFASC
jgi:hypothetical protein